MNLNYEGSLRLTKVSYIEAHDFIDKIMTSKFETIWWQENVNMGVFIVPISFQALFVKFDNKVNPIIF